MGFSYSSKLGDGTGIGDDGFSYNPVTDTLDVGTLTANNVVVTALATPTVTSVTPTLTQVGTINVVAGASLVDGDYFTIDYGSGTIPIEFEATPPNGTTGGRIPFTFAAGDAAGTIRDGLIALINLAAPTKVVASIGGAAAITVSMVVPGEAGGVITENVANAGFTVAGFANPTAATTYGYKVVSYLADGVNGTAASTEVTTAAGHATLSASNFVTVVFAPSPGSTSTRLYRTTGGTAPPRLLYTGTATSYVDTGAAGTAETPATGNTTGRVLVGDGSAAAPSVGNGTVGWGLSFPSGVPVFYAVSAEKFRFTTGTGGVPFLSMTGGAGTAISLGSDLPLTNAAAATLQLGAATSTSAPVAQTITVQGRTGTDVAGADWTHIGSLGAGSAASGKQIFRVGTPQAAGSTRHVAATALTLQDTGTGGVAAPQALFADGTAAKPSIAFAASTNEGFFKTSFSRIGFSHAGSPNAVAFGDYVYIGSTKYLTFTDAADPGTSSPDTYLSRGAAATLQLGAANAASPVSQVLQAQGSRGGTDTDVAGANLTIRPGAGTGAAAASGIFFQTPDTTASGTTGQTQATRLTIIAGGIFFARSLRWGASDVYTLGTSSELAQSAYLSRATLGSKSKAITDGSATAFASFTIADGATYTGEVIYKVTMEEGAAGGLRQAIAGRARFSAVRAGATITATVNEVGTQLLAAGSGTLTGSISIAGAAGVVTLSANFDTSQAGPDVFKIDYRFDSPDAALAITPL